MQIIATNITSPLGLTTEENYLAVRNGETALKEYKAGERGVPFDFCASLFSTPIEFEHLALQSANEALSQVAINKDKAVFILSTTKGDIATPLSDSATRISKDIGIKNTPIVVCNACISGASAIILAMRMLQDKVYDYAVVTGADIQTLFTLSGFQSLKALSPYPCRPFDEERLGLNLGEAAATIILSNKTDGNHWNIISGSVRNDAYHISSPHPKGEGTYHAITQVLLGYDINRLAAISVHGTATMYNDQMESKAIERAGLSNIPISALKGHYGHTMGAAGLLETILTARALDDGIILPSYGYANIGVSGHISISQQTVNTNKTDFLKIISGFGGCNAAILLSKSYKPLLPTVQNGMAITQSVRITKDKVWLNGNPLHTNTTGKELLNEIYTSYIGGYAKFHKMDSLSKLAFIASELLTKDHDNNSGTAVILFNNSSSVVSDKRFTQTICNTDEYYPSPALFVYTLPNITTGEIAIRQHSNAETSFYILPGKDGRTINNILQASLLDNGNRCIIGGWIDCTSDNDFECNMNLYQRT